MVILVGSLDQAVQSVVPKIKKNFFKYWWNEEADMLKQNSIKMHKIWVENGRPKNGPIYELKSKAKSVFKLFLRKQQKLETSNVSNSLHDSLMNKNSTTFWKIWKNKFGGKITSANLVEGHNDESLIANEFTNFFGKPIETDAQQNIFLSSNFLIDSSLMIWIIALHQLLI